MNRSRTRLLLGGKELDTLWEALSYFVETFSEDDGEAKNSYSAKRIRKAERVRGHINRELERQHGWRYRSSQ